MIPIKSGNEKPRGFFIAWVENCVSLKFCGISGRLTDLMKYFGNQCAHWFPKRVPGALEPGNG